METNPIKRQMIHHALVCVARDKRLVACGRKESDRDKLLAEAKQFENLAKEYE